MGFFSSSSNKKEKKISKKSHSIHMHLLKVGEQRMLDRHTCFTKREKSIVHLLIMLDEQKITIRFVCCSFFRQRLIESDVYVI